jgi:hypothetical protein
LLAAIIARDDRVIACRGCARWSRKGRPDAGASGIACGLAVGIPIKNIPFAESSIFVGDVCATATLVSDDE